MLITSLCFPNVSHPCLKTAVEDMLFFSPEEVYVDQEVGREEKFVFPFTHSSRGIFEGGCFPSVFSYLTTAPSLVAHVGSSTVSEMYVARCVFPSTC